MTASFLFAYARVSSNDQKEDLKRQEIVLELKEVAKDLK